MYLTQTSGYMRGTEQCVRRAPFLIVVIRYDECGERMPLRGLVRKVALHQVGNFMMGACRVRGERVPLSGAYGADGLPRDVSARVYEAATPMPPELEAEFWAGDGWNGPGKEGNAMLLWGRKLAGLGQGWP